MPLVVAAGLVGVLSYPLFTLKSVADEARGETMTVLLSLVFPFWAFALPYPDAALPGSIIHAVALVIAAKVEGENYLRW